MKPKILVIVGPTASGKSDLAVELASQFNSEVISADSRQVYKGLDIGTGKITPEEMKGIPHHLLDVANPKDQYTVIEWRTTAEKAIIDILSRGKLPIICGGTGFYISTLLDDVNLPEVSADPILRNELNKKTKVELFAILSKLDADRATSMNHSDRNNPRRLIRAIEIAKHRNDGLGSDDASTQKKNSDSSSRQSSYDSLWIGLDIPMDELRAKIKKRLEKRLQQGMISEVENLHNNGLSWERMEELGLEYRFVAKYLQGKITLDDMKEKLAIEIGQYAKRQMTWFKRNTAIHWFDLVDKSTIVASIKGFLTIEG